MFGLAVSFWGGRGNRPGWIATCATLHALTCFLLLLPHLVHGTYPGHDHVTRMQVGGKFADFHRQSATHLADRQQEDKMYCETYIIFEAITAAFLDLNVVGC